MHTLEGRNKSQCVNTVECSNARNLFKASPASFSRWLDNCYRMDSLRYYCTQFYICEAGNCLINIIDVYLPSVTDYTLWLQFNQYHRKHRCRQQFGNSSRFSSCSPNSFKTSGITDLYGTSALFHLQSRYRILHTLQETPLQSSL